jgi:hypothetical protein
MFLRIASTVLFVAATLTLSPALPGAAVDAAAERAGNDPLERAIQGMRVAHEQIANKKTGESTQQVQQQVVRDLERLIELAKQQQQQQQQPNPQSPSQQSQQQPRPEQQQQEQPQQDPQPAPMPMSESSPQEAEQGPGSEDKQEAEDSEERQELARLREAELARREAMLKEIWGHLPLAVRQKLLNVSGDKYLPKYEDLARRYFEALAEQEKTRN